MRIVTYLYQFTGRDVIDRDFLMYSPWSTPMIADIIGGLAGCYLFIYLFLEVTVKNKNKINRLASNMQIWSYTCFMPHVHHTPTMR